MNASEYQEKKSDAIVAAIGSAVLHLVIFLLCLWISYLGVQIVKDVVEPEPEKETIILLRPEQFEIEQPPPPPPKEKKRKYTDTNPAIPEAKPIEETKFISDRDTLAASETALDKGAIDMPTQLTSNQSRQEVPATYQSDFKDGEIASPMASSTEPVVGNFNSSKDDELTEKAKITEADKLASRAQNKKKSEYLDYMIDNHNTIESPEDITKNTVKEAENNIATKTKEHDGAENTTKSLPQEKKSPKELFSSEKKKTRIIGSLSRDGKSSLGSKSTAQGKYNAQIGRIIELEWQRNYIKYRNLIHPGIISISFSVDKNGKVSNPILTDQVAASEVQAGFTINSIRESKLPKMPKALQDELKGEKLELIYNFEF